MEKQPRSYTVKEGSPEFIEAVLGALNKLDPDNVLYSDYWAHLTGGIFLGLHGLPRALEQAWRLWGQIGEMDFSIGVNGSSKLVTHVVPEEPPTKEVQTNIPIQSYLKQYIKADRERISKSIELRYPWIKTRP